MAFLFYWLCKYIPQGPAWKPAGSLPVSALTLQLLGCIWESGTGDFAISWMGGKRSSSYGKKRLVVMMCTSFFFFLFSFFFLISCGKTSDGSSCAVWASVSWACWARHSEGHYSAGRLALAMALRSCHKGFSVRHLTQQEHSYVCRGFPWKPCKLWC